MSAPNNRRPSTSELEKLRVAVAAPGRRTMARREVLGWNKRWSGPDTETLTRHLDRVGAVRFYRTADDRYVRCYDPQDRLVMVVAAGYLVFDRPWVNAECDPDWLGIALSTVGNDPVAPPPSRAKASPAPRTPPRPEPKAPAYCPRCFLQLTTTGVCGNCD